MNMLIEITIPILNEENTLAVQVMKTHDFISNNLSDLGPICIVLADNGSTDRTQEIALELEKSIPCVKYLRLEQPGVGLALKASWSRSTAEIVGYMDLDLATDLRHLRSALEALKADKADIVTGSRLAKGAKVIGRKPLRNVTSYGFNLIVKIIFGTSFSDGMCGFKFLQRKTLKSLIKNGAQSDGWFFATEVLITGEHLKYRVIDIPVIWTDDPSSKVNVLKLTIEYLKAMSILRQHLKSDNHKS
jgi:glycosyltransferase involved in cell wall biosynthesis